MLNEELRPNLDRLSELMPKRVRPGTTAKPQYLTDRDTLIDVSATLAIANCVGVLEYLRGFESRKNTRRDRKICNLIDGLNELLPMYPLSKNYELTTLGFSWYDDLEAKFEEVIKTGVRICGANLIPAERYTPGTLLKKGSEVIEVLDVKWNGYVYEPKNTIALIYSWMANEDDPYLDCWSTISTEKP